MLQCPVCQTKYVEHKTKFCPLCGWDLQPYSFVTGLIPEVIEKEKSRLNWAKQTWSLSQQRQLAEFDQHLRQAALSALPVPSAVSSDLKSTAPVETNRVETEGIVDSDQPALALSTPIPEPIKPKPNAATGSLPLTLEQLDAAAQTSESQVEKATDEAESWIAPIAPEVNPKQQQISAIEIERSPSLQPSSPAPSESSLGGEKPNPQDFTFSVLTVGAQGQTLNSDSGQALCFSEALDRFVSLEIVSIPAGSFKMGSPPDEFERDANEQIQENVSIAAFWIGKFPITQAEWRVVSGLAQVNRPLNPEPANFAGENRPVEQVTWNDAIEFCARLAQHTDRHYRLPSEAEWEYACRAGTSTPFHFGQTLTSALANYDGKYTYQLEAPGDYREGTTAVGLFQVANAFGLYDMHGNVWEWCADAWSDSQPAATECIVQNLDGTDRDRLLRGGAWYCLPGLCRAAQRHWNQPNYGGSGIGFRVACSHL
jgi:formylglycine-generating enzyme required for sulfatase activity